MSLLLLDTTFLIDAERQGIDLDDAIADDVAVEHSELLAAVRREGRPRGAHDLLIAATARATDRTIVSADLGAFAELPGVATRGYR